MDARNFTEILEMICDIPSNRLAHIFDVPREVAEIVQESILDFMDKNTLYIETKRQAYLERMFMIIGRKEGGGE